MRRAGLASFMLIAAGAAPALATGEMTCSDGEGVSIDLLVGRMEVAAISRAVVTVGGETWSTQPEVVPGRPLAAREAARR